MTRAADVLTETRLPARIVVLPASAWASGYTKRPVGETAVGLRLLSEQETARATTAAEVDATETKLTGEARDIRFNDELMVQAIGFALCDPNHADRRYFTLGADEVRQALTPQGLRRLWDELEIAHAEGSPLLRPATDSELADLGERLLDPDGLAGLSESDVLTVRRLAGILLDLFA